MSDKPNNIFTGGGINSTPNFSIESHKDELDWMTRVRGLVSAAVLTDDGEALELIKKEIVERIGLAGFGQLVMVAEKHKRERDKL